MTAPRDCIVNLSRHSKRHEGKQITVALAGLVNESILCFGWEYSGARG